MNMLVTRPEPDAAGTVAALQAIGIDAVAAPMLERQSTEIDLPPAAQFTAVVVTSANTLRSLDERGELARYCQLPLFAVGDHTAQLARQMGFAMVQSAAGGLSDLVAMLLASKLAGPVFYPAAEHRSGDLAESLRAAGIEIVGADVYRMVALARLPDWVIGTIQTTGYTGALFYSRRTAISFVAATAETLSADQRCGLPVLSISAAVAAPLLAAGFSNSAIATHPDEASMLSLALAFAQTQNKP